MSDTRPPLSTTTSLWPAAVVLLTGVVMLVVFTLINTLGDKGVQKTVTPTTVLVVGGLALDPQNHLARGCEASQNPPSNIASALLLPIETTRSGKPLFANQGAGDFSCSEKFRSAATASDILAFYQQQLSPEGWQLFSQGSSTGKPQSLFQKAGSDGFYWVLGVTINSSKDSSSVWTLKIYQNSGQI